METYTISTTMTLNSSDPFSHFNSSASVLGRNDLTSENSSNESLLSMPGIVSSSAELDFSVIDRFRTNRRVNDAAFFYLVAAYCVLIVFGTLGNSLVVYVVARQPAMRTARNVFVVNLAISDLLLCLITMPLTLMEIRSYTWPLGNSPVSCKMVGSLQAVSIFVSTLSITAIALDRYQLIVYPTKRSFQLTGALVAVAGIWAIAVVLALPLFIVRTLQHLEIPIPNSPISSVDFCLEDWPSEKGRSVYSIGSILVQYALPIATVSVAHARICHKLRFRMTSMQQQQQQQPTRPVTLAVGNDNQQHPVKEATATLSATDERKAAREEQLRKTNILLVAIAIIFSICWLPMNIFNVVVDTWNVFGDDTETMLIVYAVCHMVGMSSACANPLLYGWLNDNFRKEFQKIGASLARKDKSHNKNLSGCRSTARNERTGGRINVTADVESRIQSGTLSLAVGVAPSKTAVSTAVTMLPSSTNLTHSQTEVTAVTHLVVSEPINSK